MRCHVENKGLASTSQAEPAFMHKQRGPWLKNADRLLENLKELCFLETSPHPKLLWFRRWRLTELACCLNMTILCAKERNHIIYSWGIPANNSPLIKHCLLQRTKERGQICRMQECWWREIHVEARDRERTLSYLRAGDWGQQVWKNKLWILMKSDRLWMCGPHYHDT